MTYSPRLGRFTQPDPLGFKAGDTNFYAFVGDNPTSWTDPTGLEKGVGGNVEAIKKAIGAGLATDPVSLRRVTSTWAKEAQKFAKELREKYEKCTNVDGERIENAARHMYWMMLITSRYGPKVAEAVGDAHEAGESSLDSLIDQYHNKLAREKQARWHERFSDLVNTAMDKRINDLAGTAVVAPPNMLFDVTEDEWRKQEERLKQAIKSGITRMLTGGDDCPCKETELIIDWNDPRIKKLPGYDPNLKKH